MVPYLQLRSRQSLSIPAGENIALHVSQWPLADGATRRGTALIVHGLGEHGGRYGHVASILNELGLEVWAHDHRGFGKSGGDRARIPHRDTLIDETKLVYDRLAADGSAKGDRAPPVILGHSMGGAIVARAVTGGWIAPRAMMLSSPGLKSYLNAATRIAVQAMEFVTPSLTVPHGLPLDRISHDVEVLEEAKSDPLNHALISPRITMFIVDAGEATIRDAGKLTAPVLVQAAGDDKLVDPEGAREFAAAAPRGLCTLKIYDGLYHEIFNEREADRTRVLTDLKSWLAPVLAA